MHMLQASTGVVSTHVTGAGSSAIGGMMRLPYRSHPDSRSPTKTSSVLLPHEVCRRWLRDVSICLLTERSAARWSHVVSGMKRT